MRNPDRALWGAGALFLAIWFFALAGAGLGGWFSGDDLMNLYRAWSTPWWKLARANVLFFGGEFRPLGDLWYRAVFAGAGFDPLPFHVAAFAILLANIALAWLLARRLAGGGTAAAAALLTSYNARFANLYFDTGAIYDVLCFFFYYAALLWYVRLRQRGAYPDLRALCVLAALTACALNAKEMAVTLPAAILLYEAAWRPPRPGMFKKWAFDEGRGAIASGAVVLLFLAGMWLAPGSAVHSSGYELTFTAERALSNAGAYFDHIFYRYGWFTPAKTIGLWLATGAAAWIARSKAMRYAWLLAGASLTPMLFAAPRGGSAIYICLFAWALYWAALAERLTAPLGRLLGPRARHAAVFLTLAAALYPLHRFEGRFTRASALESGETMRKTWNSLSKAQPRLPSGARVLFLDDPLPPGVWDLDYLVKLGYGDDSLRVARAKSMKAPPDWAQYDFVFDRVGGAFVAAKRP